MSSPREAPAAAQRGIQSIEVGGALLKALAHHGRPLPLKDLAARAGMAPAKAHPYLVSFGKIGLVERDATGRYGLGPLAMQLGLISLQALDPVALGSPLVEQLATELGHTTALAVWGNHGATIVRVAEANAPVHVSMRHGTVMSLRATASGRLFAAHLPRAQVAAALRAEGEPTRIEPELATELERIRSAGFARVQGLALPGVSAMAAPVFDSSGSMVLALTVIGPSAQLEGNTGRHAAQLLADAARRLSAQLGCREAA
ncbi:MAG: IclR family transcriptional regulator [Rubrivivax sp.]|nr:IclR family transcriptional regulator [Rubrivivax sp.]